MHRAKTTQGREKYRLMDRRNTCTLRNHLLPTNKMRGTDFDVCSFCLHKFTDDFAELVRIGELSGSRRRWEGRVRARRRGHTLGGIHVMETAAESSNLFCTLGGKNPKTNKKKKQCRKLLRKILIPATPSSSQRGNIQ